MIYKTKVFQAIFKKAAIKDQDLIAACDEMSRGLVDADLGGHLFKKRIAAPDRGKSSSYRTIVGAVIADKYFFLYMFAKGSKPNISEREKFVLKELAAGYVKFDQKIINELVRNGELLKVEVHNE